ncbi:MAG: hypothetical protein LBL92_00525 [Propionibacteriaceae bacterium]|jgi:Flp pilus assembly protein TadG|nr:hypothetical protein [Propionibacteriaceae bacterium]
MKLSPPWTKRHFLYQPLSRVSRSARNQRDREAGGITLYVVIFVVALLAVTGLVVDGSGRLQALERAADIAREAARTAAQNIDPGLGTNDLRINSAAAVEDGRAYLTQAGCLSGDVTVTAGSATATCIYTYDGIFIPLTFQVTGTGTAQPVGAI